MGQKKNRGEFKTLLPPIDTNKAKWWLVDLSGANLGRTAIKVADILRGKNKPVFTPHLDAGDHVVVINAKGVKVSGKKELQMAYYDYSGYPGGLYRTSYRSQMEKHPDRIFQRAVRGMLPKSRLGAKMLGKLHIYAGGDHPHVAQKPEQIKA